MSYPAAELATPVPHEARQTLSAGQASEIATTLQNEQTPASDDWQDALRYLPMFIDEARQTHDEIIDALLALEAGGGKDAVRRLGIALHRLKGSAASIGLVRLAELVHAAEDLLQVLSDDPGPHNATLSDVLFAFADGLQQQVEALRAGRFEEDTFTAARKALQQAAPAIAKHPLEANRQAHAAQEDPPAEKTALADRVKLIEGQATFQSGLSHTALKAHLLYEKLTALGNVAFFQPPLEKLEEAAELKAVSFGLYTDKPVELIRRALLVGGIGQVEVKPQSAITNSTTRHARPAETMRVEIERLERLLNLAGQLTLCKMRFLQLGDRFAEAVQDSSRPLESLLENWRETTALLGRLTDAVQRCAMEMRMTPIGPLLARFNRVVRDIRQQGGKDVRLLTSGEKTELDKRLIDELVEPLIHLIRNAADHGIEARQERLAAGKLPHGTITLEVCRRGHNVIIRLADDGRGIDIEKLRQKALQRSLITLAEAERMSHEQLLQLVWLPGLSTRDEAGEVSGRGMGMDLVCSKIERLGGAIELQSRPGQGTSVSIKLPVTLVVLVCLHVEIDGAIYALPLETVEGVFFLKPETLKTVGGRPATLLHGRIVPVLELADFFGQSPTPVALSDRQTSLVVVLGQAERQVALRVERLLGVRETLVKSLAANYRNIPGVAGASVDGAGRVLLILDPTVLIEQAIERLSPGMATQERKTRKCTPPITKTKCLLD